jgi:hypothetical protein
MSLPILTNYSRLMSPQSQPSSPPLTVFSVAQLGEIIDRFAEDPGKTSERLRGWTRKGRLTPLGLRHPGRGSHRIYGADSLISATILTIFADWTFEPSEAALQRALAAAQAAWNRWQPGKQIYLVFPKGRRAGGRLQHDVIDLCEGSWAAVRRLPGPTIGRVVIDLHEIFKVLRWPASRAAEFEASRDK